MGIYRLLLACLVVAVHAHGYPFALLPDIGLAAVAAFFFISGYLMPCTFQANYAGTNVTSRLGSYYLSRFKRIFPFYWISLAIMLLPLMLFSSGYRQFAVDNPDDILKQFLLFGLNQAEFWGSDWRLNGPAWTLDIELQYYVLAPFLVMAWLARPALTVTAVCLVALAGCALQWFGTGLIALDRSLLAWSPLFGAGFLAALYQARARKVIASPLFYLACAIAVTVTALAFPQNKAMTFATVLALTTLAAHLTVGSSPKPSSDFDKLCGDLSYPVYIFHTILPTLRPVIPETAPATFANWLLSFIAILAFALAISLVVHFVIGMALDRWRAGLRTARPLASTTQTDTPPAPKPV